MQLTLFRLAPLLGLQALICLFHLNARPAWSNWIKSPTPPPMHFPAATPWELPIRVQPIAATPAPNPPKTAATAVPDQPE
jgi:hypothetical protein